MWVPQHFWTSSQAAALHKFIQSKDTGTLRSGPQTTSFQIKNISAQGTERLGEAAIEFALAHNKRNVVFAHTANIMQHTEGLFKATGYQVCPLP